jgi:zinc protease
MVKRAGQTGIVGVGHKTPEGLNQDTYALQVLGKILTEGKISRLYKRIVDPGLATSLFMYDFPFKDCGMFISYVFLTPETDHNSVEEIILGEYRQIIKEGIKQKELDRAKAQIKANIAFSRDGSYAVASALNEAIAIGDWTFYSTFMDHIIKVSRKDIQRVAEKYLIEDQSTTGWFIPQN